MNDSTLDTRAGRRDSRRPIVVLLVDDQTFVGAAVGQLLESESDIELHCCLSAVNAIAMANQIAPTRHPSGSRHAGHRRADAGPVVSSQSADGRGRRSSCSRATTTPGRGPGRWPQGADGYLVKLPPKAELIACIRHHASRSAGGGDTLDLAVIDRFHEAGAPDFTRRLIDQFIREAGARVGTLKEAAGRADAHALNATAHSLKGSSMIMGASRLAALCAQVEDQMAVTPGGEVAAALMAEIDQELVRVQRALTAQKRRTRSRMSSHGFVGDLLIRAGVVDAAGLALGLEAQSRQHDDAGTGAGRSRSRRRIRRSPRPSRRRCTSSISTASRPRSARTSSALLPAAFCQKRGVAPLGFDGNVAARRGHRSDGLFGASGRGVPHRQESGRGRGHRRRGSSSCFASCTPRPIARRPTTCSSRGKPAGEVEASNDGEYDLVDPASLAKDIQLPPIVKLVNLILSDAAKAGASDVHIEPHETHAAGPAARRRAAARRADHSAPSPGRDALAPQDHVGDGHRRAPQAAGRPQPAAVRGTAHRSARVDDADAVRREDRHPAAEHRQGDPADRSARPVAGEPAADAVVPVATRRG